MGLGKIRAVRKKNGWIMLAEALMSLGGKPTPLADGAAETDAAETGGDFADILGLEGRAAGQPPALPEAGTQHLQTIEPTLEATSLAADGTLSGAAADIADVPAEGQLVGPIPAIEPTISQAERAIARLSDAETGTEGRSSEVAGPASARTLALQAEIAASTPQPMPQPIAQDVGPEGADQAQSTADIQAVDADIVATLHNAAGLPAIAADTTGSRSRASSPAAGTPSGVQAGPISGISTQTPEVASASQANPRGTGDNVPAQADLDLVEPEQTRLAGSERANTTAAATATATATPPNTASPNGLAAAQGSATAGLETAAASAEQIETMHIASSEPSSQTRTSLQNANALSIARAPEFARAVAQNLVAQLKTDPSGPYEIRLDPPELGRISVRMVAAETGMVAQISADRQDVLDQLRRTETQIARDFAEAGFEGMAFSFANERQSAGGGNENAGNKPETGVEYLTVSQTNDTNAQTILSTGRLDIRL